MGNTIFRCEHPVRIVNPYTHKVMFVPCRKCSQCRARKASEWTEKLNRECRVHPFSFFGTLTFAPEFLPYYTVDWENHVFTSKDDSHSFSFDPKDLDDDSIRYINSRHCLPLADISLAERFIKRLRERIRSNKSGEPREVRYIRYYLVPDYGSTVLRPHFHFILCTASKWFAENAKDVVSQCWCDDLRLSHPRSFGRIDCQSVKNSCSSYVAGYLACLDSLPKVYSLRYFRPFAICSKHPSIGDLFANTEEVRELFNSGSVVRSVHRKNGEVLETLLPKSICDRLYPRISGFSNVPGDLLRSVYQYSDIAVSQSFDEFFWSIKSECDRKSYLGSYFCQILAQNETTVNDSTVRCLLSNLKRFSLQRQIFGISVNDYFDRIVDFWKRRDYKCLEFQEKWLSDLSVDKSVKRSISDFHKLIDLERFLNYDSKGYHLHPSALVRQADVSFDIDPSYVSAKSLSDKIVNDHKSKHYKSDYLDKANIENDLKDFLKYINNKRYGCISSCSGAT